MRDYDPHREGSSRNRRTEGESIGTARAPVRRSRSRGRQGGQDFEQPVLRVPKRKCGFVRILAKAASSDSLSAIAAGGRVEGVSPHLAVGIREPDERLEQSRARRRRTTRKRGLPPCPPALAVPTGGTSGGSSTGPGGGRGDSWRRFDSKPAVFRPERTQPALELRTRAATKIEAPRGVGSNLTSFRTVLGVWSL